MHDIKHVSYYDLKLYLVWLMFNELQTKTFI